MNTIFLDTVGILARWDRNDQWHEPAARAYDAFVARGARTVTTEYVLLECGNAAARRPYRSLVGLLRDALQSSGRLIEPTDEDWDQAWTAYQRGLAGDAGIVDHVPFVVMRRYGITNAFTNDRHFRAAGFQTLF